MRAPNARDTALGVLVSCRTAGAWADAALKAQLRRDGLSGAEAALCSRIVYGVMQDRLLLDFYLGSYCSQKIDHLQPPLAEILRIGAYQILFLDKVPDSAAVNQAVEQAKANGRAKASGLVNAVLRQVSRNKNDLPLIPDRDEVQYLSIRYSHPKWLVKRLLALLGREEAEAALAADNATAPLTVQINPLKTTVEDLTAELESSGVIVRKHPWVPGCLELENAGDLTALAPFQDGKFLVQDPAARLVSQIAGVRPGMRVLDVCAAPGGKSFAAAFQMKDRGGIVACDLHENKLKRIQEGAERQFGLDFLWWLWAGRNSPIFGRDRMTTFERRFIEDEKTWAEPKNAYYTYYQDPAVCEMLLAEFGLVGKHCHIINGHVPVKVRKGESPVKGGGKLIVIDGGFSKAYQPTSGIAGYTLIFNSRQLRIVSHQPFAGKYNALHNNDDIENESVIFENLETRMRISQTDEGAELQTRVEDLMLLLEAYRSGAVTEDHKN